MWPAAKRPDREDAPPPGRSGPFLTEGRQPFSRNSLPSRSEKLA